jgi:hypothetical protein
VDLKSTGVHSDKPADGGGVPIVNRDHPPEASHCGLACAIARQPLHDIPIQAPGSRSHQERRKFAPRRAQSGVVRGGRREPISRQPPRADLPRDLPADSWHQQEPATARLGVTGSPAHLSDYLERIIDLDGPVAPVHHTSCIAHGDASWAQLGASSHQEGGQKAPH